MLNILVCIFEKENTKLRRMFIVYVFPQSKLQQHISFQLNHEHPESKKQGRILTL